MDREAMLLVARVGFALSIGVLLLIAWLVVYVERVVRGRDG